MPANACTESGTSSIKINPCIPAAEYKVRPCLRHLRFVDYIHGPKDKSETIETTETHSLPGLVKHITVPEVLLVHLHPIPILLVDPTVPVLSTLSFDSVAWVSLPATSFLTTDWQRSHSCAAD